MKRRRKRVSQKPFLAAPFLVVWELLRPPKTDWGALQAEHNIEERNFSIAEKKAIVDKICDLGCLKLVLSGGDLFNEEDLLELVSYAKQKGLQVAIRPNITRKIEMEELLALQEAGVYCLSINLDGPIEEVHDKMNFDGSFTLTKKLISNVIEAGIPLQLNTSLSLKNAPYFKDIANKVKLYPVLLWNVVMTLVNEDDLLSASECELIYQWLYDYSKTASFDIKTTSGQQFHRVIIQNKRRENKISGNYIHFRDALLKGQSGVKGGIERAPYGINDGKGMLFISSAGNIYPSSMLPIKIGHIDDDNLVDIYQNNQVLKKIKDSDSLKGKCGICEFRNICGGSRARVYLVTGDYMAADPYCFYKPSKYYKTESIVIHDNN